MKKVLFFTLFLAITAVFSFCKKEKFTTDEGDKLAFSTDTLRFDTVFTTLGSATRFFKIYNPHKKSIRISKIYLAAGAASRFNLNVDGTPGDSFTDLEIAPEDSMYVFAEVTINPNAPLSESPFILDEDLIFETNGNTQTVVLEAWGQNANYIPSRFSADSITVYDCGGGEWVWDDPKPYVVYGRVFVVNCTLRLPAGTHVYVHGGLYKENQGDTATVFGNDGLLSVADNARLVVEGTLQNPVIIEDDRLEPEFDEETGQWAALWLQRGTKGNRIENCIIRNGIIGVYVDSAAELSIKNTQIYQTSGPGLYGFHSKITAENCLFHTNGGYSIRLDYGGEYKFDYCTAAQYGVDGEALSLGNVLCKDEFCQDYDVFPLKAEFYNCIFYGTRADEVSLVDRTDGGGDFDYVFKNTIVRVRDLLKTDAHPEFFDYCAPCINADGQDTIFLDPNNKMYRLDTLSSIANRYAAPLPGVLLDLDGKTRDALTPDAGCYEIEF